LSQHGTVLSEVLLQPGPTHSVFDVLAAACLVGPPVREIALLGFGGGSVVAALRALGCQARIHAVDLDPTGLELLRNAGALWLQPLEWHHADAVEWLRSAGRFDVILDDLSIPRDGDVEKPNASWDTLPALIARHLRPNGIALFNLLRPAGRGWTRGMADITSKLSNSWVIHLDDFENRILVSGRGRQQDPVQGLHPRTLGTAIRSHLRTLGSLQRKRVQIRRWRVVNPCPREPMLPLQP
jgi:SAM-dependent methyltransferase